ncbi:disease resistance protein RPV1 isoform X2 [Cryptomeria japonica]|nr:disease resistance protein RPV1 isoform X2 [Cryptomeria japonica]
MLLKSITYCVVKEIKKLPFVVAEHPVGLDEIVQDFELTTLQSDRSHQDMQMVGIWGMGGSGKTTLAKKLYNNIYPSMEKASLILDIRDAANKNLLCDKQKKLLEDLGFKGLSVDNVEEGKAILASHLRSIRALIVLDDVDHVDQLNALLPYRGSESLIGSGALIIVTTRELEVLRCWDISSHYKMKPLSAIHAEQLFCWHAFLKSSPQNGFDELVEKFLEACSGLPLSFKVLGGQLYGNVNKDSWKTQLEKISRILPKDIKYKLKISYDALDEEEQEVFLDIACFFVGEKSDLAIEVWIGSGWSGLYSLERLRNKCLVEIDEKNYLVMHDHLRDLGREIANEQSPYRLWSPQQCIKIYNKQNEIGIGGIMASLARVLNNCLWFMIHNEEQIGIGIRGILTTSDEEFDDCSSHAGLMVNTSRGIRVLAPSRLGLRIIEAHGCNLIHVISEASGDLVWLRWFDIGQTNIQSIIPLKKLRVLELCENWRQADHRLLELWVDDCDAPLQLRELIISYCKEFRRFPNSIGRLKQLRKIVLDSTKHLESLPEEFCQLQSLEHLELNSCDGLSSLPNSMGNLRKLRHLSLLGCKKLGRLPDSCKELRLLQHLSLSSCPNVTFMSDIMENMSNLEYLSLTCCYQLEELPRHITNQVSLRELHLEHMWNLREIPVKIDQLNKLQKLCVGGDLLTSLPASLGDLSSLTALEITNSTSMECLPDSLGRLSLLERLEIDDLGVKSLPESISQLTNLESLWICRCPISELDLGVGSFSSSLSKLKTIELSDNDLLSKISISKDCCAGLESLTVEKNRNLTEIKELPSSVRNLVITRCPKLSALPSFAELTSLREFEMIGCYQVKKIEGLNHCRELEALKAYTWWEMPNIESLEYMERLRVLHLTGMRKSVVEGCIQGMEKWPGEIIVSTRAVRNAASLVNSLAIPTLSVVDSCSNVQTERKQGPKLVFEQPTNGNAIIVCFVVRTPGGAQMIGVSGDSFSTLSSYAKVEEGAWVWIGLFTQRSKWYTSNAYEARFSGENGIVEKGLVAMVEEDRVTEVLRRLLAVMEI